MITITTRMRKRALNCIATGRYDIYYKTRYWKAIKHNLLPHPCFLCGETAVTCHHLSYDNMGYEKYNELIPICQFCHKRIHDKLNEYYPDIKTTTYKIRFTIKLWPKISYGRTFNQMLKLYNWKEYFNKRILHKEKVKKPIKYTKEDLQPRCKKCDRYAPGPALNNKGLCRHCL